MICLHDLMCTLHVGLKHEVVSLIDLRVPVNHTEWFQFHYECPQDIRRLFFKPNCLLTHGKCLCACPCD